jgi:PAS domain S-box-containing protein
MSDLTSPPPFDKPFADSIGPVDLAQVVENDTDALVVYDGQFRYIYVNPAAEVQLKRARTELLGRVAWEEFPEVVGSETYEAQMRAMRERVVVTYEAGYEPLGLYFEARVFPYNGPEGGLIIYWRDISDRKRAEREQAQAEAALAQTLQQLKIAQSQQRRFLREMLQSLTEGRLRLCDGASELPFPLEQVGEVYSLSKPTLRALRHHTEAVCMQANLPAERCEDLVTATGEASMNAVIHAGGGEAFVCADATRGIVQVWVRDSGGGISEDHLHRATLEKGYSTVGTLGHGFWMILKTCDRVFLLTGPEGTTLVLEQERNAHEPSWMETDILNAPPLR